MFETTLKIKVFIIIFIINILLKFPLYNLFIFLLQQKNFGDLKIIMFDL